MGAVLGCGGLMDVWRGVVGGGGVVFSSPLCCFCCPDAKSARLRGSVHPIRNAVTFVTALRLRV